MIKLVLTQNFSLLSFQILDASYHSGTSLQTSAMILLCSVLLLIFIFVSSILIWKWVQSAYVFFAKFKNKTLSRSSTKNGKRDTENEIEKELFAYLKKAFPSLVKRRVVYTSPPVN